MERTNERMRERLRQLQFEKMPHTQPGGNCRAAHGFDSFKRFETVCGATIASVDPGIGIFSNCSCLNRSRIRSLVRSIRSSGQQRC